MTKFNIIIHSVFQQLDLFLDIKSIMGRVFSFFLFFLASLVLIQRQRFVQPSKKSQPGIVIDSSQFKTPSKINQQQISDSNNYYRTGQYDMSLAPVPKLSILNPHTVLDILSRKKINGFMFSQYNLYKLEINFIDLGYSSLVQINYWTHDMGSAKIQEKVGFSLPEDLNEASLNLDIDKKDFKMTVRQVRRLGRDSQPQTVTSFNITASQGTTQFETNYTHVRRDQQCMTAVRNSVISHKCYGGYGYGKLKINQVVFDKQTNQKKKKMSSFNPKANQTRCSFDGFRGSGFDWKWTWAYGTGFSKPEFYAKGHTIQKQRWIGFNFGSLYNKSEDFLFLNGKVYPMQGVKYVLDSKFEEERNITVRVQKPKINMNFTVMDRSEFYQDMGVLKNHMIKAEGHWIGELVDPQNSTNIISFYQMSGMMEVVASMF